MYLFHTPQASPSMHHFHAPRAMNMHLFHAIKSMVEKEGIIHRLHRFSEYLHMHEVHTEIEFHNVH